MPRVRYCPDIAIRRSVDARDSRFSVPLLPFQDKHQETPCPARIVELYRRREPVGGRASCRLQGSACAPSRLGRCGVKGYRMQWATSKGGGLANAHSGVRGSESKGRYHPEFGGAVRSCCTAPSKTSCAMRFATRRKKPQSKFACSARAHRAERVFISPFATMVRAFLSLN